MLAASAAALAGCQKVGDDAFGQRVHAYLMAHPEVIREAAQKLDENERVAAAKASTDAVKKYRAALENDPRDAVVNPNGTVTLVEFFDYRCGYCKLAAPEVAKIVQENPDVRFVLKQFPIFGQVSDTAAKIALTPQGKAHAMALYQSLLSQKALDDQILDAALKANGLDPAEARKASESPAIDKQLADARQLATALKIEGTPAFVVGDTLIPGADIQALRAAVTVAKAGGGLKKMG
jgi:protein-disulfide isomerase